MKPNATLSEIALNANKYNVETIIADIAEYLRAQVAANEQTVSIMQPAKNATRTLHTCAECGNLFTNAPIESYLSGIFCSVDCFNK